MPQRRWTLLACLVLVLATLFVYGGVCRHPFINLDDDLYIIDNPQVQQGLTLKGVAWAFTTVYAGFWHPLTWLSHMLDCQLFGLWAGGHHLTSLLFHVLNTLLLFLWLRRATQAMGPSFVVAALFALHPLHVESVAWAAERKDVLSTFFWLLTMWAYLWYIQRPDIRRYLAVLACFALGLMAKPMLVTLPLVLLLLDYWPLGRLSLGASANRVSRGEESRGAAALPRLLWEKVPLLVLAMLIGIVTFYAEREIGALKSLQAFSFSSRVANALVAYVVYLLKMLWPARLAVFYPHPGASMPLWPWMVAGLLLVFLSLAFIPQARRRPYLAVGWLWYLVTLAPVIGIVQIGSHALADRYTYVPLIGPFIMVAWGLVDLTARRRGARVFLPAVAGATLLALAVCTFVQVRLWRDPISLFEHTLQITVNNYLVHNNLGTAYDEKGQVEKAMLHYSEALRIKPDFPEAHNNLGRVLVSRGQAEQAISQFNEALRLRPTYAEAHCNLADALASQGQAEQAMTHYTEALHLKPNLAEAYNSLGITLAVQGKTTEAKAMLEKAIQIKPNFSEAYNNLGLLLMEQGEDDGAIAMFEAAVRTNPQNSRAQEMLSVLKSRRPRD